jgi:hypothetical protein
MKKPSKKRKEELDELLHKCSIHIAKNDVPYLKDSLEFPIQVIALAYLRCSIDLAFTSAVGGDSSKEESRHCMGQNVLELTKHFKEILEMYEEIFDDLFDQIIEMRKNKKPQAR